MKILSFETANSYVKVWNGEGDVIVYPNTLRQAPREFITGDNQDVYTVNDESYIVGKTRNYISSSGKGVDRYTKPAFYVESLIALSHYVKDGDKIIAATGLPSIHYTKNTVETLKRIFEKRHTITIGTKQISFEITELDVYLQPLGSYFYSLLDSKGGQSNLFNRLVESEVLVVDIGFGSTDLAELSDHQLVDYQESGSAMLDAYLDIIASIKRKYSGTKLETADLKPLHIEGEIKDSNTFSFSNDDYAIGDVKEEVFDRHAKKIIYNITNVKNFDNYDTVIFAGGGVSALEAYLSKYVKSSNALVIRESQVSNVKGFLIYSKYGRREVVK
jgi:hypothetical protein